MDGRSNPHEIWGYVGRRSTGVKSVLATPFGEVTHSQGLHMAKYRLREHFESTSKVARSSPREFLGTSWTSVFFTIFTFFSVFIRFSNVFL